LFMHLTLRSASSMHSQMRQSTAKLLATREIIPDSVFFIFFFVFSYRWWQMPEICIMPSIPLLASFQQLTELSESSHILQDLSRQQNRGPIENQYSHLKDILETWRLRTPNEWERVSTWSDIMLWRNVIYNIVINAFQSVKDVAPHLHQLGYRDRAWSVNRQATNVCTYGQP